MTLQRGCASCAKARENLPAWIRKRLEQVERKIQEKKRDASRQAPK